jgi:UDP-glucose 4-epimerase
MRSILVLGSEGFIGRHLVQHFLQAQYIVHGCDLFETAQHSGYIYTKVSRLSPEWEEIFSKTSFDFCVNAAGSGNVPYSMTHPLSDFEANTLDTIRVLDAIRRLNKNCRYLHISSAAVYGNPEKLPIDENDRKCPLSPYGWNKLMAEQICSEYASVYGVAVAIIRPFSVYGKGLKKQLLWDICTKLHKDDVISLFGTGKESRDFIHIDDLADAIMKVIENSPFNHNIYNTASGTETSIKQVADIFEHYFPGKKTISFSGVEKKGDPVNWKADISRLAELSFQPKTALDNGIIDYINWYGTLIYD